MNLSRVRFSVHMCMLDSVRRLSVSLRVKHFVTPSRAYLQTYFEQYIIAWNIHADFKRDDKYVTETVETLSEFNRIHVHVAEDANGVLKAGTILIEIRDVQDLNRLRS